MRGLLGGRGFVSEMVGLVEMRVPDLGAYGSTPHCV
jgi:hypothetical protein